MKCEDVKNLIHEYIDGELSEVDARGVEKHLESCPECSLEHKQLSRISGLVFQFGGEEAPAGFMDELHAKIEKEKTVVRPIRSNRRILALAATFIFAILGVTIIRYASNGTSGFKMNQADNAVVATAPAADKDLLLKGDGASGKEDTRASKKKMAPSDAVAMEAAEAGANDYSDFPAHSEPIELADDKPSPTMAPAPSPAPLMAMVEDLEEEAEENNMIELAAEPEPVPNPDFVDLDEDFTDDETTVASFRAAASPSIEAMDLGGDEMAEEAMARDLASAGMMARMDSTADAGLTSDDSLLSEGELARAEMLEALNYRERRMAADISPAVEVAEEEPDNAAVAGAYPGAMSIRSAVPATRPVVYTPAGGPSRGFTYYEMPREPEVIRYFVAQNDIPANIAPESAGETAAPEVMADVPAEGGGAAEGAMAKTVTGIAGADIAAGYGSTQNQPLLSAPVAEVRRVARAVNVFVGDNPIQSAIDCENMIIGALSPIDDSLKGWERNRNYIVVQGSFENLAPLREKIYDTFSGQPAPENATATYSIPDDYLAVLEIYFMQAQ